MALAGHQQAVEQFAAKETDPEIKAELQQYSSQLHEILSNLVLLQGLVLDRLASILQKEDATSSRN